MKELKKYILPSVCIAIVLPIILEVLIFKNSIPSTLTNGEWSSFLGSYIGGIFGGMATLIAVLLSINMNTKIQYKIQVKEKSVIIYHDLVRNFLDLKKIYINLQNTQKTDAPSMIYFSKKWIEDIAVISSEIKEEYVDKLYEIYRELEVIQQDLDTYNQLESVSSIDMINTDKFTKLITQFCKEYFSEDFIAGSTDDCSHKIKFNIEKDVKDNIKKLIYEVKKLSTDN